MRFYDANKYSFVNILENDEIRTGMKEYSDWPTFPQLYVDGEFVGGSDIVMELHKEKKLKELFN